MKKILISLFLFVFLIYSCQTNKTLYNSTNINKVSNIIDDNFLKKEINNSIIDGFYNNDTTNLNNVYLLK